VVGAFVPTIIAVLFTIPWGLLDTSVQRLEPFYQLSGNNGASASNSLLLDYPGTNIFMLLFKALFKRHWIVLVSAILYLVALLLAPLASETVFIGLSGTCNAYAGGKACIPTLSVYLVTARVIEVVLVGMGILTLLLIIQNRHRSSGVFANPHSIAAVATLFHNPEILQIFLSYQPVTKEEYFKSILKQHRYQLGYYNNRDGTIPYGFLVTPGHLDDDPSPNTYNTSHKYITPNLNDSVSSPTTDRYGSESIFAQKLQCIAFAAFLLGLMIVIIYYKLTDYNTPFERFMDSQGFGVRFIFTLIGVIVKKFWEHTRGGAVSRKNLHELR
jgi:hypothetical protein